MLDVVFLSRIIPIDMKAEVLSKRKGTMSESGESLQWKLINGLDANLDQPVTLMNFMPIQSYPKFYSEPYVKGGAFSHTENAKDINLSFLNMRYIKRLFMGQSLYREIKKWAKEDRKASKVIVCYSLIPEFMKAIVLAKQVNPEIHVCAVVADLPEYTVLTNKIDLSTKIYLNWMKSQTHTRLKYIDSFALLTEQMADVLVSKQNYVVVEGIATEIFDEVLENQASKTKRILYAGTLNERFGVLQLLEAFRLTTDSSLTLTICGIGDAEEKIKKAAQEDIRIEFLGQVDREEVLRLMKKSAVIVNPRYVPEEFTKYSFPSKNMEALSSGIPFVAYKLAGIPDEYDPYINYPKDDRTDTLAALLETVCKDADGIYAERAVSAKEWILTEKNALKQTQKIIDLIQK